MPKPLPYTGREPHSWEWPLELGSEESLVTDGAIACDRCGLTLLCGIRIRFSVVELVSAITSHALECRHVRR